MIQRKQSVFLFFSGIISIVSVWFADLWKSAAHWIQPEDNIMTLILFLFSAFISLATIFLFKNRALQLRLNMVNIILNILLIGYLAYGLSKLPGGFSGSEKGIGLLVPLLSVALLFTANRYIQKDEKLVKSIDRFR